MKTTMSASLAAVFIAASAALSAGQTPDTTKSATSTVELTGCVSLEPGASGQYGFVEATSGGTYRLTGKGIRNYAGQRVTVIGDPNSKKVKFRFGLWPSPNVAAQAGALDPAQESIARQPGGLASGAEAKLPELRVVRMRGIDGSCR